MIKNIYVWCVSLCFFNTSVFAYECSIYEDSANKFVLGSAMIGETTNKILGEVKKLDNCFVKDGKYMDCELRDSKGVNYLVESEKIIRKEVIFNANNLKEKYILNLSGSNSLIEVLERLKEEKSLVWSIVFSEDEGLVISTEYCIKNAANEIYAMYFVFGKNYVLKKIGSRLNW